LLVVDDALLLRVLGGVADSSVIDHLHRGELYTSGAWYLRLSRAVHDTRSVGALTRELAAFDEDVRHRVLESLDELPDRIGLVSWRRLVPVMSVLDVGRGLNLLAAEALALGLVLGADIAVTTDTPLVRDGSAMLGLAYRVVAP
jgi:hypothetical protein